MIGLVSKPADAGLGVEHVRNKGKKPSKKMKSTTRRLLPTDTIERVSIDGPIERIVPTNIKRIVPTKMVNIATGKVIDLQSKNEAGRVGRKGGAGRARDRV
jgi:hypothetical protein